MSPQPSALAALALGLILGQEPPPEPESTEDAAVLIRVASPQDHSQGWVWRRTLQTPDAFVDLAQDPQDPQLLLAVDLRGGVWQSVDGGQSWEQTLRPATSEIQSLDEEELLLQAEATAEDFFDEEEVISGEEDENLDRFEVDANDVDLLVERGQGRAEDPSLRVGGELWFHPERGGVVLLSRSDGLWRSMDSGARWRRLSEASTLTSMLLMPDGSLLAGSPDGVKMSRDAGANWRDSSGMTGVRVRDLAQSGGAFFAATDQGLYLSLDGMVWAPAGRMGAVQADLRALQADPRMSGGLWVATDTEVLRSDDGGQSLFALSGTPLPGTANLHRGYGGLLVAATRDGIWESLDGGVRWQPASYGLPEPVTADVVTVQEFLVVATPEGLWRMEPEVEQEAVFRTGNTPGLSLDDTLFIALNRPGMKATTLRPIASLAPRLVPDLVLTARASEELRRGSDYEVLQTVGDSDTRWFVGAQLTWNRSNPSFSANDGATTEFSGDTYYVLDGNVLSTQDATALPVAAANAQAKSVKYQRMVSGQVTDLYLSRSTLLAEQSGLPGDDLRGQTLHALKIQETTALLDAYTDGRFSSSAEAFTPEGETP